MIYNQCMKTLTTEIKDVISKSEMVLIATRGKDGPHLVATWGEFVASLDVDDGKTLLVPAGGYKQTEKNLAEDDMVVVMVGSKQAPGKSGNMGTGYRLNGRGKIVSEGAFFEQVKAKYAWARAALVIEVDEADQLM